PPRAVAPGESGDAARPVVAQPQRVGPVGESEQAAPRSKRWLIIAGAAVAVVLALVAGIVLLTGVGSSSPEEQVRTAITEYTDALGKGDLDQLRATTCGPLHDFYQGITAQQFDTVHRLSNERGSIPVVSSVTAVRITGDTALAEAQVYTKADTSKRTARTFDLQRSGDEWKVCDPAGTQ
ncbi:Rv0361 family membrane protein, partial [Nocardia thailandica]|uniref:Rv0361 family membrane protein n=1 Tax=Nocardia thailandica TaxID=257275 RepID=UPI0005B813E0